MTMKDLESKPIWGISLLGTLDTNENTQHSTVEDCAVDEEHKSERKFRLFLFGDC